MVHINTRCSEIISFALWQNKKQPSGLSKIGIVWHLPWVNKNRKMKSEVNVNNLCHPGSCYWPCKHLPSNSSLFLEVTYICISAVKESNGDSVPLVNTIHLIPCASKSCILWPGLKHQYEMVFPEINEQFHLTHCFIVSSNEVFKP